MRGRRPVPTRMKVLTGNPGKRPLNEYEPQPEPTIPDCPPQLGPIAREEWDRLIGELASLRIITALDRSLSPPTAMLTGYGRKRQRRFRNTGRW